MEAKDQPTGFAAIDFGSTATRACIVVNPKKGDRNGERRVIHVQELRADNVTARSRFEPGEYPSVGCPFDGPPFYVGFDAASQATKRLISLKSIPYFRTNVNDRHPFTEALHSHFKSLPSKAAQLEFEETLDDMLLAFFTSVVNRIIEHSESDFEGFQLQTIALCIPNTWSARENQIQEYLSPILDKTVTGRGIEFIFQFEAQDQVQFMLHRHSGILRTYDYLMVVDFGGHSMGGSHGELRWGDGNRPRFFSPPESDFGVRGGYEIWELQIGQLIEKERNRNRVQIQEKHWHIVKAALLGKFFERKAEEREHARRLTVVLQDVLDPSDLDHDASPNYTINLTGEQVKSAWEDAFRDAIDMAKDNISRIVKTTKDILILLSGGSIKNTRAREELTNFCLKQRLRGTNANIDCKHILQEIGPSLCHLKVSEGGALCLAATMDAEEFFDHGGAFALRMSMKNGKWTGDHAKLLFCKDQGAEISKGVVITISGDKKFTIIADPFYGQQQAGVDKVFIRDCYDIWDICLDYKPTEGAQHPTRIPDGRYTFEVAEMVYAGTDAMLII
ncbi:hypothetical protein VPNG_06152 [Cytospora leucostoma]|uniref:Actin-like ATPase domain-containing protein n=1 Tax=Cytospora leucostoma TaxID=1230097 RepID=A0A423WYY4_9PEZI|nr:hypothetical protein VPNG_06152 [Cytospora leucostoma]